jgi:alpha-galactosidase
MFRLIQFSNLIYLLKHLKRMMRYLLQEFFIIFYRQKELPIYLGIVFFSLTCSAQQTINLTNWKFQPGDDSEWAQPGFDDSNWKPVKVDRDWESQGYGYLDGYAWYRIRFRLPTALKNGQTRGAIRFTLGHIDDCDQTYLNGKPLGRDNVVLPPNTSIFRQDMSDLIMCPVIRNYIVAFDDPRLIWEAENVVTVRVYDLGGAGGMSLSSPLTVSHGNLDDYIVLDSHNQPVEIKDGGTFAKTIKLKNLLPGMPVSGHLSVDVIDTDRNKTVIHKTWQLTTGADEIVRSFSCKADKSHRLIATYRFDVKDGDGSFSQTEEFPYILTPVPSAYPKINGARVVGVRPGAPFLFRVPATGASPLKLSAEGLPDGLTFEAGKRILSGRINKAGNYSVKLVASNSWGITTSELKIVVGDRLALTPPMGWNSWNCFGLTVDQEKVMAEADHLVSSGLADHGWTYINLDDGWEAPQRDADGRIQSNKKFSDMKGMTDYIHELGLKAGIYSSPGPSTCGNFLGSYEHEKNDASSYAEWGFDYLKYDWCSYSAKDGSLPEMQKPFVVMNQALRATGRDFVFSFCQYGMAKVWEWGGSIGGNAWRTATDISDSWESMSGTGFNQDAVASCSKPGNWNDPDMLVVGWVGWGNLHPTRLTPTEQYTHISLWCMLSAPMLLGCDLTRLDDFTINLLANDEVIAINQDTLGRQGISVIKDSAFRVMVKDLADGTKAVALFNMSETERIITVPWDKLGLNGKQKVRDLWRQKDLGVFDGKFESTVPSHGVMLVRMEK